MYVAHAINIARLNIIVLVVKIIYNAPVGRTIVLAAAAATSHVHVFNAERAYIMLHTQTMYVYKKTHTPSASARPRVHDVDDDGAAGDGETTCSRAMCGEMITRARASDRPI